LGVTEDTVINWGVRGKVPRYKAHIRKLSEVIPGAGRFFDVAKYYLSD
jgi:hypothetical protein